jgi:hypothetical protein
MEVNELNLRGIAIELLIIDRDFHFYLKEPSKNRVSDFELYTFEQTWGNTSGGFEGIGGSAMTNQRTYVFVPTTATEKEECLIFFGARFAYHAPYNETLRKDLINHNMAGISQKAKYRK